MARTRIFATYTYHLPPTTNTTTTQRLGNGSPYLLSLIVVAPAPNHTTISDPRRKKSPLTCFSPIQMISEVTPRGKEFLFFSLFSIIGKTSSFIGPFISSAIIDDTGNNSSPFYFLFALSLASFLFLLFFVDVKQSRVEQADFLERERLLKEEKKNNNKNNRKKEDES